MYSSSVADRVVNLPKRGIYICGFTAGILRFLDIEGGGYEDNVDADMMLSKMRTLKIIVAEKGAMEVGSGAWSCGTFSNPVSAIAKACKRCCVSLRK